MVGRKVGSGYNSIPTWYPNVEYLPREVVYTTSLSDITRL